MPDSACPFKDLISGPPPDRASQRRPRSLSMARRPMTEQERIDAKTLAIEVSEHRVSLSDTGCCLYNTSAVPPPPPPSACCPTFQAFLPRYLYHRGRGMFVDRIRHGSWDPASSSSRRSGRSNGPSLCSRQPSPR